VSTASFLVKAERHAWCISYMFAESKGIDELYGEKFAKLCSKYENTVMNAFCHDK